MEGAQHTEIKEQIFLCDWKIFLYLCKHCLIVRKKSRDFLSYALNSLPKESICLQDLLSARPHDPPKPFHAHGNPSVTAAVIHVHETEHELRPLGGWGDKNHGTDTEKGNVTLLLPNSVAKLSLPSPSLTLLPQKHLPSRADGIRMHWSSSGNAWERQLRKGLMKTSFVGYLSASCCFKHIPVYIVSVAAPSLAFLGPLLDPCAEIRMFGIAVVLPWLGC